MNLIENLLRYPKWSPLAGVVEVIDQISFISANIYKLSDNLYLRLTPSNAFFENGPDAPYVTAIIWAVSDGAVLRLSEAKIESDIGGVLEPPKEILPAVSEATYGEIISYFKNFPPKVCQEKASYRIATDGAFIHRVIETEGFLFAFRSPAHDSSEKPYAIIKKL
ncbi:hypothetical protein [Pseudomonas anguilliseptica]|uniref:hypothetical protein n=1 Tax=Pseudomonas anguilliseptica TaxID=53406 RepID=UPI0022AEF23A|nr:hypothetical protein [Pseudomonas anguilliseptica]MCZ4324659.1 hypothetical protein [Pseudomonas anguilliseptica]